MSRVLYTIIVVETGDIYAWTENKDLADLFIATRKPKYFKIAKAKPKIPPFTDSDDYINWQFSLFESQYRGSQLMSNVLGKGDEMISMPTTYNENAQLEKRCNTMYDELLALEKQIQELPLDDEVRETFDRLVKYRKKRKNEMVTFDSFAIFVELFGETML